MRFYWIKVWGSNMPDYNHGWQLHRIRKRERSIDGWGIDCIDSDGSLYNDQDEYIGSVRHWNFFPIRSKIYAH